MVDIISPTDMTNTKRHIDDIAKTMTTKQMITPLWGPTFESLPLAVQKVIETGGFEPFATEAQLKASVPTLTKKASYALDTHNIFLWENGAWTNTGMSAIDQSNSYTDKKTENKLSYIESSSSKDDILVAIVDALMKRTWLEANNQDGGLTAYSKSMLERKLGFSFKEHVSKDYFFALTDQSNNLTDITLRNDGQFADFVIHRLAKRLNVTQLPLPSAGYYYDSRYSKVLRAESTNKMLATWGSSSIDRSSDYISARCYDMAVDFIDGGVGGEVIDQTANRMGELLQKIKFTGGFIPPTGIEVPISVEIGMHYLGDYDGWIIVDGVRVNGRIDYRTDSNQHYFLRKDDGGNQITVDPSLQFEYTPTRIEDHKIATTILWAGKNNLTRSESSSSKYSVSYCIKRTRDLYLFLTPMIKRCLVIGHFVDSTTTEEVKQKILQANMLLKEEYGDVYLDIQEWMCSPQLWIDTGITPTSDDLIAQSEGRKPQSVSQDSGHFTYAVYNVIVNKVIFPKLNKLGWY